MVARYALVIPVINVKEQITKDEQQNMKDQRDEEETQDGAEAEVEAERAGKLGKLMIVEPQGGAVPSAAPSSSERGRRTHIHQPKV